MEKTLDKQKILEKLNVTQKKTIIKGSDRLNELFKINVDKPLSKAKAEDIDLFINSLVADDLNIFFTSADNDPENKKNKNADESENQENDPVNSQNSLSEKIEREIPDLVLKKVFRDLYPTAIHKTKYVQENPSLKMAALTKGIFGKNVKKEDIDDFLVKQVPKNPKSMKQLAIDWLENKKNLKPENDPLLAQDLSIEDVRNSVKEFGFEDLEAYAYLMQSEISEKVFDYLDLVKSEEEQKRQESGSADSEKVKELESKLKSFEVKLSSSEEKSREEIGSLKQNYENEKEKLKAKYEQKLETLKNKNEEEKGQLVKIQADSDRRFSDERKSFYDQIEKLEKENKKLLDRLSNTSTDLLSQNKQNKDINKELSRLQNKIDELQSENREVSAKSDEIKTSYDKLQAEILYYKKQETSLQLKVKELSIKIQELEKTKIAFLLNESELQNIVKELNSVDETKERILQLLNIDTHQLKDENEEVEGSEESNIQSLDDLWVKLIEQEEEIIADYLSAGTEEVATKELLKEKIDSLLDLEYNLKAREVLVKTLYEKGYKAYKHIQ